MDDRTRGSKFKTLCGSVQLQYLLEAKSSLVASGFRLLGLCQMLKAMSNIQGCLTVSSRILQYAGLHVCFLTLEKTSSKQTQKQSVEIQGLAIRDKSYNDAENYYCE